MDKTETGEDSVDDAVIIEDLVSHLENCNSSAKVLFSVNDSDPVPLKEFVIAGDPVKVVITLYTDIE